MAKRINILVYNDKGGAYNAAKLLADKLSYVYSVRLYHYRSMKSRWSIKYLEFILYYIKKCWVVYPYRNNVSLNVQRRWKDAVLDCDVLLIEWLGNGSLPKIEQLHNFKGKILIHHHDEMYLSNYYYQRYVNGSAFIGEKYRYDTYFESLSSRINLVHIYNCKWLVNRGKYENVKVINNLGLDKYSGSRELVLSDDATFVVVANRIAKDSRKGVDRIVNLAVELKRKYKFILIGEKEKWIRKFPGGCKIESVGYISLHQMEEYFNKAYASLIPSYADTYPNVSLESAAFNLPVIVAREGGSKEVLEHVIGKECDFSPRDFMRCILALEGQVINNDLRSMNEKIIQKWVNVIG